MNKLELVQQGSIKKEMPAFNVGDTVKVFIKIPEGDKVRLHPFEGTVIARKGKGSTANFVVRKVSYGEGIERVFPLYAPTIDRIEIVRQGKVRRSKLYYLRTKIGKETKIEATEAVAK